MTAQDHHPSIQTSNNNNVLPPSFKILNNTTEITTTFLSLFVNVTDRVDGFGITDGFPMILENNLVGIIGGLRNQGKKIRYITEINKDNLPYCKMMGQVLELRHVDKINGAMMINDNEYLSIIESKKKNDDKSLPVYMYSNNIQLVSQQHQIFDILWEKAISLNKRVEQIETRGRNNQEGGIELIYDKDKALSHYKTTINSAADEIIVFYYASNEFGLQTLQDLTDMIRELIKNVKVKVKIIVSLNHVSFSKSLKLDFDKIDKGPNFQIKHIKGYDYSLSPSKNLIMLLADKKQVLITKTNYKTNKEDKGFDNTIEYTLYSTSPSVVYAYKIILENLWKQNDLYKMLEIANMKLEFQEIMQQELIHNFANGLRNPVQPLLGLSEILLSKEGDLSCYKDILKVIHYCAQKLTLRINNVLNSTEIENNTHYIRKEFFNLLDLIDQSSSYHCNNNFYEHRVHYQINYHGDKKHNNNFLPIVYADKNKIKLVIDNLLINAIDYAKAKELYISITRYQRQDNCQCNNDNFEIRIMDDGKGIDDSILDEMFSKYKTDSNDGLGLGLYLAKSIVEAHGGQIWAQNNKDRKGATISFCIPVNG